MTRNLEGAERRLTVVGGGLAGCEAAWQAARRGIDVTLREMKPLRFSPAHSSSDLAELVCSNSLRSNAITNAVGLLKEEMRRLDSLVVSAADESAVPAGRALAVDRVAFAKRITEAIESHPRIAVEHVVVERIPASGRVILATGPLTAPELARDLQNLLGDEYLYFYDALSPIVYADSIDHDVAFRASRYEDGDGDYLNLPLGEAGYEAFVDALLSAETVPLHRFEASLYFEGPADLAYHRVWVPAASDRRLALDGHTVQRAQALAHVGHDGVLHAGVVPEQQIPHPPVMPPGVFAATTLFVQKLEQRLALRIAQPFEVRGVVGVHVQSRTAGFGVSSNHRMRRLDQRPRHALRIGQLGALVHRPQPVEQFLHAG